MVSSYISDQPSSFQFRSFYPLFSLRDYFCILVVLSLACYSPVQFSSVAQSCLTLCDPMNCSMPGLPVHHQLLESTQTHVHLVGDAIQPSYPLSSPSSPALNLSQHLFKWSFQMSQLFASGGQSIEVSSSTSVFPMNTQD